MSYYNFIFVRHCESENNQKLHSTDGSCIKKEDLNESEVREWMARDIDPNLTEKGMTQAKILADYLNEKLEKNKTKNIICHYSPFKRTLQTAEPFIKLTDVQSELKLDIIEWTPERKRERLSVLKNAEEFNIDDSWESFLNRAKKYLQSLEDNIREDDPCTIVIFTHSMFISACISIIAVRGTEDNFVDIDNGILPRSPNDVVFHLPNGSITIFDCQPDINQKKYIENRFAWRCLATSFDGYFDKYHHNYPEEITTGRWW